MKGLSLVEILLVIMILAVLVGLGLPVSLDFYKSQQLDVHSRGLVQTLRRAQLKAMSVEDDSAFGVYLTNDNYTLFRGDSFASRDVSYDELFDLPQVITVSGIQEVVFLKFEGSVSATGDIVLSNNIDSLAIDINELGRVNLE